MDPVDFAIYRYLSPGGEARFWAGRRVLDPTIPIREIAERVGISENGVRARLRGLTERGYVGATAVTPNPSLFGVRVVVAELPVKDAGDVERILRDIALVDGAVFARDVLDEEERKIRVHFISDSDAATSRRTALLRRLSPTGLVRAPEPYWIPPCDRDLSSLDWRVLRAVWNRPDGSMAQIASAVGISLKTTARRLRELRDSRACWWTPGAGVEEFPLALVRISTDREETREAVLGQVAKDAPSWMPVANDGAGTDPAAAPTEVVGLIPADLPTALERTVRKLAVIPGVRRVRRTYALGSMIYPSWYGERIDERAGPPSGRPRR